MVRRNSKRELSRALKPYLLTIIAATVVMVIFSVSWSAVKEKYGRDGSLGADEETADEALGVESSVKSIVTEPQETDGSARAGIMPLSDEKIAVSSNAGLYSNDYGTWYAPVDGYCYYNGWVTLDGQQYHFDSDGYMDTGWTAIAGGGYYFDDSGVYDPDKDGSMLIALTFDDGPTSYTSEVLDLLEEYGASATFMMLGVQIESYGDDTVPRMIELGCTIGNHSNTHARMSEMTTEEIVAEFEATDELLAQYGVESAVVRFPFGDYESYMVEAVGKPQLRWTIDSRDWESRDAEKIISEINSVLVPGSVVLMHDIFEETVEALTILIPSLIEDGYELVSVEELAASRGYELEAGVSYLGFTDAMIERGSVTDE